MKKVVLQLDLHDDKQKQKALKAVAILHGIDSMGVDMKEQKMTVIGTMDPVEVVKQLRKFWPAVHIFTVGPGKEEKKDDKKDDKKPDPSKFAVYPHWYPPPPPAVHPQYFVRSAEEDPNSCVIC